MTTDPSSSALQRKTSRKRTAGDFAGKVIAFTMMAFLAVTVHLVAFGDFVSIKDDLWLNSHGVLARHPSLYVHHGRRTASGLCAYYDTQEGKSYSKCIELWFPLVLIDEHSPEVIHYNPASPEHISTSWGRQVLFSRTFSLLVALAFAFFSDLGIVMLLIATLTGADMSLGPSAPPSSDPPSSNPAATPGVAAGNADSSLQSAALELSATLSQIVAGLQSQTGPNAPYAQAVAAELTPLIAQYNRAVEVRSRDQASSALDEVFACMDDFKADKKKRHMSFGFRHWQAMRHYESLRDLFRETKYRNDSL